MAKIFLGRAKASLITLNALDQKHETRRPAVGIFIPLDDTTRPIFDLDSESASKNLGVFHIDGISPYSRDPQDTRVRLKFSARGNLSQEMNTYSIALEVQYVALAVALAVTLLALNEPLGGLPLFIIDSKKYKASSKAMNVEQIAYGLLLPEKELEEGVEFQEKLSAFISSDYISPLAPYPWDQARDDNPTALTRNAQSSVLMNLLAITHGDLVSIDSLISSEEHINTALEQESEGILGTSEDTLENSINYEIFAVCYYMMKSVYSHSRASTPELQSAVKDFDTVSAIEYNPSIDMTFSSIVSDLEKSDELKNVKISQKDKTNREISREENIVIWNKDVSLSPSEKIRSIYEYLTTLDDAEDYKYLLAQPLDDEDELNELAEKYGFGKIFTTMSIKIADYALRKGFIIKRLDDVVMPAPLILSYWVNMSEDDFMWEFPALSPSLSRYNFENAVDIFLIHYEPQRDIRQVPHLWGTFHFLGHHLLDFKEWSEWSSSDFALALDKLENNTNEFNQLKKFIIQLVDKIHAKDGSDESDEDQSGCIVSEAMSSFISEDMDVESFARMIAMSIPVLADMLAMKGGLTPESDKWENTRMDYISNVLYQVAVHFGDRIQFAIR